ncbi:MAG: hypothetical protein AAF655_08580 [Bacteroidota bacterium]
MNYLRNELAYIDYVRDPQLADVHLLVTRQTTGAGAARVQLDFIGKEDFEGMNQSLIYQAEPAESRDNFRRGYTRMVELGLVGYLSHTTLGDEIEVDINVADRKPVEVEDNDDPWDYWVFKVDGGGNFRIQSQQSSFNVRAGLNANRVTEDLRIRSGVYLNQNTRTIINEEEEISSKVHRNGAYASVAKSLSSHWSYGMYTGLRSTTFNNIQLNVYASPAIEYSLFPYAEVARREITLAYRVGPSFRDYYETTIYEQDQEMLWSQALELAVRIRQPWGSVFAGLEGRNFFHDFSKNRIEFNSNLNLRVYKGLALNLAASMDFIRDQLSLPKGDTSLEDVLLQQRQLATDYEAFMSIGVSYTFGSTMNNIVNTRL